MKRSRFTDEQIIGVLKEREAGTKVADLCRGRGMSEAKRLHPLKDENAKPKRRVPDAMLDNAALKDLLGKNGDDCCEA